jgi:hypothetical protein
MPNAQHAVALTEKEWSILLSRIPKQRCTPFLGAEVMGGLMPPRSEIAKCWAAESNFPLENPHDLAQVAQFVATTALDANVAREKILDELKKASAPNFNTIDEPHRILAELPLEVYITTDYHDFMVQALKSRHRDPRQELCRWSELLRGEKSVFDGDFKLSVANPVVFHLYGHMGVPESLVLTEDDYLDFLVEIGKKPSPITPRIEKALARASLLFLGYRLTDLEFRVLLRSLATVKRQEDYRHVAVQLVHVSDQAESEEQFARLAKIKEYYSIYCDRSSITTYWGTTHDFLVELKQRWDRLPEEAKRPPEYGP